MIPPELHLTLIGGPTLLLEIGELCFLTDPTFDPAGGAYDIGIAMLHKTGMPTQSIDTLYGRDIVVLLSHDEHADNLDIAGRAFLPTARKVFTTVSGAARLSLPNTEGLAAWESREIAGASNENLVVRVTGTPARHGPEGSEPMVGDVTGFVLEWGDKTVYLSGDTVWYDGVAEIARRFPKIDVAVLFLGGVRPSDDGPLLTMDSAEAVQTIYALNPQIVVPIHYEGWQHFREGRTEAEATFAAAGLSEKIRWLKHGEAQTVDR